MKVEPLVPYAKALQDHFAGHTDGKLRLRSSLGEDEELPVSLFFRGLSDFFPFELAAMDLCRGRVLDLGAGSGVHSVPLQENDFQVTAVEVLPEAVEILRSRGVQEVRQGDFFQLELEAHDTVLLLMNGVGPSGTLDGLDRLLTRLRDLVVPGGQVLLDSSGAHPAEDAVVAGDWPSEPPAYPGEAWIQLDYLDLRGAPFRELYVDEETLAQRARSQGWNPQVVFQEVDAFLMRLARA